MVYGYVLPTVEAVFVICENFGLDNKELQKGFLFLLKKVETP